MTGVSGDTKPTEGSLITGTTFHETNTDDLYIWDGDSWNIVAGASAQASFLDEDNFASDSATAVASQQSIKAYIASQISGSQNVFSTIAVSGQDNVVADATTDTLTLVAGSNMTLTTSAGSDSITFAASGSGTVTITDNESTNENNLITFVADAATSTGAHGLEMDGDLHYNPSTGTLTSTVFAGNLTGNVTGNASGTAATVTGATQSAITTAANLVTVGALDSGSITSGFTSIDVGSGAITTTGTITAGNIVINGTTTTINSTTVTVDDPVFTLGGDTAPGSDDNKDRGIEFRWHNGSAAKVGFFGFDDSTGKFTFIPDATNSSEVFSGTAGTVVATTFEGALTGNVTGNVSGTAANVTGTVVTSTGGTGLTSYTAGDIVYYASGTTLTKLAKGTAGQVLTMNSGATAPEWAASGGGSGASESFAIAMAVAL